MSEDKPYQDKQGLVEWSKWISGISLFSASGCVGVNVGLELPAQETFPFI